MGNLYGVMISDLHETDNDDWPKNEKKERKAHSLCVAVVSKRRHGIGNIGNFPGVNRTNYIYFITIARR